MAVDKQSLFRELPAVDHLLVHPAVEKALASHPKGLVKRAINQVLDDLRDDIRNGVIVEPDPLLGLDSVSDRVLERLRLISMPSLKNVINATGVVVHTNLGRSILSDGVIEKFRSVAGGYSNLEYDLAGEPVEAGTCTWRRYSRN